MDPATDGVMLADETGCPLQNSKATQGMSSRDGGPHAAFGSPSEVAVRISSGWSKEALSNLGKTEGLRSGHADSACRADSSV